MKNILKSEKGAITLVTLVTLLFVMAFLMTLYIRIENKVQMSYETTEEIAAKYNNVQYKEGIYASYFPDDEIIPIYTVEQLQQIGSGVTIEINGKIYTFSPTGYYVLQNDLNLNEGNYTVDGDVIEFNNDAVQWTPLRPSDNTVSAANFTGTLDGLGYSIKGLYFSNTTATNLGLFKYNRGTIKNVVIEESKIEGKQTIGAIAAINYGTIDNCIANVQIFVHGTSSGSKINADTGGIAGGNGEVGTIKNTTSIGTISEVNYGVGHEKIGGLIGYNNGLVDSCKNYTNIIMTDYITNFDKVWYVGGICGQNYGGIIRDSENFANIEGGRYIGGITGSNNSQITNCKNKGEVKNIGNAGGTAGIVGTNAGGIVSLCKNYGNILGRRSCTGGIIGDSGSALMCYNCGNVSLSQDSTSGYSGGICGLSATIDKCYNEGVIYSKDKSTGGIIGALDTYVVSNCYNKSSQITGHSIQTGGIVGLQGTGIVRNCYNIGTIASQRSISGRIEYPYENKIENCYTLIGAVTNSFGVYNRAENKNYTVQEYLDNNVILMSLSNMTNASFVTTLNSQTTAGTWVQDNAQNPINNGYPILSWQVE